MDFHLINLDCPACGSAMTAGPHDIIFLCRHCGSGAVLGDSDLELVDRPLCYPCLVDERCCGGLDGRLKPRSWLTKEKALEAGSLQVGLRSRNSSSLHFLWNSKT